MFVVGSSGAALVQFWTPSPVTQRRGERVPLSPALRDRRGGPELD